MKEKTLIGGQMAGPQPRVIAFNYTLKNSQGEVLDASEPNQPLPFLEGKQQIIPALESVVSLLNEGDKRKVSLKAAEAYGEFREDMIMEIPKEELAHLKIEVGSHLQLKLNQGVKVVKVSKVSDSHVTLDGNHPLAGQDLEFDVEIMLIRPATAEELQHGHAHGLHGHAHHH
jgi:FKBP-type peptidyl-prolyl cis-trans isomerase SlyD